MKLGVIGATGQLGSEIVKAAEKRGYEVEGFRDGRWWVHRGARWYGDVTDPKAMREILETIRPDVVINTAAFHPVDECERNPQRAFEVNALGSENVASICRDIGALYVFVSTDYVFGGAPPEDAGGYDVHEVPYPLNVYGWSKMMGENAALMDAQTGAVARVSYLFGKGGSKQKGGNCVDKVLQRLDAGLPLQYHSNMVIVPTCCADAAEAILNIQTPGIYHCNNAGKTSLHGFARAIARLAGYGGNDERGTMNDERGWVAVQANTYTHKEGTARRPEFSVLMPSHELGIERTWAEGVTEYLREIGRLAGSPMGEPDTVDLVNQRGGK